MVSRECRLRDRRQVSMASYFCRPGERGWECVCLRELVVGIQRRNSLEMVLG